MEFFMKIKPNPRAGMKQIIAFLETDQIHAAYNYAIQHGMTNQEVIGTAINQYLKSQGFSKSIPLSHERIQRRNQGRSKARILDAKCRIGKRSFSGWFPKEDVDIINMLAQNTGVTMQNIIVTGLNLITGHIMEDVTESIYMDGVVGD